MPVVKVCALESLRDAIVAAVPALADKVCVGSPDDSHWQGYPYATITAGKWRYEPFQEAQMGTGAPAAPNTVVYSVGDHEAPVQVRIGADTPFQRDELAQAVLDVFLSATDAYGYARPGVLMTDVTDCAAIPFRAAWELEEDELVYLPALDRQHEAVIQLLGIVPALVTRTGVYTIDELHLGIASMDVSVTADTFAAPHVEVVSIQEDGSIIPA